MRVVSLLPSATEIVCAIGAQDLLVAKSHECDWPAGLADLPSLTDQKIPPGLDAGEIDRRVREQMGSRDEPDAGLYTLNADALEALQPDLILTQDLCEVCSIDLNTVRKVANRIGERTGTTPAVLSLNPGTVEDILDDILRVGEAIGRTDDALATVLRLKDRLFAAQEYVNPYEEGPVVGFLEWTDPLFVAGHWTVQLIERAGGRHPLNETIADESAGAAAGLNQGLRRAGKSLAVPREVFAAVNPRAIIICPCGMDLEAAAAEARTLGEQDWFRALPAVRAGKVAVVDGSQMFNRPGPRVVEAFEWLVGWLQDRPHLIAPDFPWRAIG